MRHFTLFHLLIVITFNCGNFATAQPLSSTPIIPDFQVSETSGSLRANQSKPVIAVNDYGDYVLVWIDGRIKSGIFAQRFTPDGSPIGNNFKIQVDIDSTGVEVSDVIIDNRGNIVVTWLSFRNGGSDIYGQIHTKDNQPAGSNFAITDNNALHPGYHSMATDSSGNFVVTWEEVRGGGWSIYAQRFDYSGSALGTNFKVNDYTANGNFSADVSSDKNGNFVITWLGSSVNGFGVQAQMYNSDGTANGSIFKVNEPPLNSPNYYPAVSHGPDGGYTINWIDVTGGINLYAQRFDDDGLRLGATFRVNSDSLMPSSYTNNQITYDNAGKFIILWEHFPQSSVRSIYGQQFAYDGTPIGFNFRVTDDPISYRHSNPAVASYDGDFMIAWENSKLTGSDIHIQNYMSDGTPNGDDEIVNDDTLSSAKQTHPSIAVDGQGNFIAAWYDPRDSTPAIYAQRFSANGSPIGQNIKINQQADVHHRSSASIACDANGNFVVVWTDRAGSTGSLHDIYAQGVLSDGTFSGDVIKVNDVQVRIIFERSVEIAMDTMGRFAIIWRGIGGSTTENHIFVQLFSPGGTRVGDNRIVNDSLLSELILTPDISMNATGDFIIAWMATTDGQRGISGQRFSPDGSRQGHNFRVYLDSTAVESYFPGVAINNDGGFLISWFSRRDLGMNIWAQRFTNTGIPVGNQFQINNEVIAYSLYRRKPEIDFRDNKDFIIAWETLLENSDVMAQRFAATGTPIGDNARLTLSAERDQESPDVAIWNNRIYSVWQNDVGAPTHDDIWANVWDFDQLTAIDEPSEHPLPKGFKLSQNYPNPFNPSTTISIELPLSSSVTLEIFNVMGQRVVGAYRDTPLRAGIHEWQWNGADAAGNAVASGVYFYRLTAGEFVQTRKMLLVR